MTFTSQKENIRKILNSHKVGDCTTELETHFITAFFRLYHPEWYDKTKGQLVLTYHIIQDSIYSTKCFQLEIEDGTKDDIGYSTLTAKPKNITQYKRANICQACRTAIDAPCIKPLREEIVRKIRNGIPVYSEYSGKQIIESKDIHIDHYDVCFKDLVSMWIEFKGLDYLFENINMGEHSSTITKFTDQSLADEFVKFHNLHTLLRVVTKNENLCDLQTP